MQNEEIRIHIIIPDPLYQQTQYHRHKVHLAGNHFLIFNLKSFREGACFMLRGTMSQVFCAMYVTVSVRLNTDLTTLVFTVLSLLVL